MFENKRFLITQPSIRGFNGSTLVALELATALQKLGAKVTLYTCDFAKPASTYFQKANLHVDTLQDNPNYKLSDFNKIFKAFYFKKVTADGSPSAVKFVVINQFF